MNKTAQQKIALVFPSWAGTEAYRQKTAKFLEYYSQPEVMEALGLQSTKDIWIVDNASTPTQDYFLSKLIEKNKRSDWDYRWKRYPKHYGRPSHLDYLYCWRALYFGRDLFQEHDYDKVIHMNNDSFILSKKYAEHIRDLKSGWIMPYCPQFNFPECDINIYTKDSEEYWNLTGKPYKHWNNRAMENVLRSAGTIVEKQWIGDRYWQKDPKVVDIPKNADFATQVVFEQEVKFGTT